MKILNIITLILFSYSVLSEDIELNTLTIRTSVNESKSYKIKKITKTTLSPEEGSIITIETNSDVKCIIPLEKIIQIPRAKRQECVGCVKNYETLESYYSQLFLNGVEPNISCDVTNGETVGFHFLGATKINGTSSFNSTGMLFDVAEYSSGPFFRPEEEPNAFEEVLNDTSDILLRLLF